MELRELSKELEKSEKQFHVLSVFGRKSKGRAKREDSDFGELCPSN